MTLKSINKKFAVLSLSLLAAATLAGAGTGISTAFAATGDTTNQVSNGEVKIYAQSAAGNTSTSSADGTNTDEGVTNNQTPAQAGNSLGANDGTTLTSGATMAHVKFTAQLFTGTGTPTGPSDTGFAGTKVSEITDGSGLADFTGLTDGYWKFSQTTTVNGITTVNDFIVYVNTTDKSAGTVNIYPKLDMSKSAGLADVATTNADDNHNGSTSNALAAPGATKGDGVSDQTLTNGGVSGNRGDVDTTNSDSTWTYGGDSKLGNAMDSEHAGNITTAAERDTVNWNVNTVFDSSQTNNNTGTTDEPNTGSYVVTDQLPDSLVDSSNVKDSTVIVNVTDGSGAKLGTLTPTDDYTVTTDGAGKVTIKLTQAGQLAAAKLLTPSGAKEANDGALNIVIPTTVREGAVGSKSDSATTTISNAYGADLSTTTPVYSTLNVGALDFQKKDASDSSKLLADATFVLVKADNMADAQAYVKANAKYFVNDAAQVNGVAAPAAGTNASFVTDGSGNFVTTKTDQNGVGVFKGLNLVDDNTDTKNTTNYFAVEVQAPTGYQLPTASNAANVFGAENASTTELLGDGTTNSNVITNAKPFALPFTGGEGLAGIVIIATVAGMAAFVIKRNKRSDEEVVVK